MNNFFINFYPLFTLLPPLYSNSGGNARFANPLNTPLKIGGFFCLEACNT